MSEVLRSHDNFVRKFSSLKLLYKFVHIKTETMNKTRLSLICMKHYKRVVVLICFLNNQYGEIGHPHFWSWIMNDTMGNRSEVLLF